MLRAVWQVGGFPGSAGACSAAMALLLLAGCGQAAGQGGASSCAPPPPWSEASAKPGQPQAELAACLADQAYQIRNLAIPVESAANGIVAQCEVRVDKFENVTVPANDPATEQATMQQATADVTQYRQCAGK
jgi:hypothetical protein